METSLKSDPLEIVERVARNLPITGVELHRADTDHGTLYFAIGLDKNNAYHGVWAFTEGPGVCRPVEFKPNQSRAGVLNELKEDGYQFLSALAEKGMLDDGFFRQDK